MLPMPAIRRWSSRNDLIGALRPRASTRRCSAVNSGVNGSTPIRSATVRVARRVAEQQVAGSEPPGIDVREAVAFVELEAHARVRRLGLGVEQQRPGHPQVHE